MRVLLTTDTIGGVWSFTKEHTQQLLNRGHEVALVSLGRPPSESQMEWADFNMRLHPDVFRFAATDAPLEWMQENDKAYTEALAPLLQTANEFRPDIIHSSQFCFGALPLEIPTLVTAHSDVLSWAEACQPDALNASKWLYRYKHLVQRGLDLAQAVVAPTEWMLNALRHKFTIAGSGHVVFNGRDLPAARREPRPFKVISAGRLWDRAKNVELLAQCCFPITLVGDQSQESSGLRDYPANITNIGLLSEEQLFLQFCESSVYVAPSLYEPFGLAPLEAALCGCAIVANDIPSFREVWGNSALYFRTPDQLQRVITHLQSNQVDLQQARLLSQAKARKYTAARMTEQYLDLYKDILQPSTSQVFARV